MVVYISATIISAIFAWFSVYIKKIDNQIINNRKNSTLIYKIFVLLSFLPLFLVSALRYDVGTDYFYRYVPGFQWMMCGGQETYEKGFLLINKIVLLFTRDYAWLFILTSFLFCFFVYKAIYQQSEDIVYSILLLVVTTAYFISMNTVRQCVAVAIFLYATKYIKQEKFLKYLIWIIIAGTIHMSAYIYIPVYFLCKNKVKTQIMILIFIIVSKSVLTKIFIEIISLTKYYGYFNSAFNTGEFDFWTFAINFSILIFCYVFYKQGKNDMEYKIFTNIQFISVSLLLFSATIPLISRIIICFTFSQIIFLPKIFNYIKNRFIRNSAKFIVLTLYIIYMINTIVIRGYHEVLPYQTIFSR